MVKKPKHSYKCILYHEHSIHTTCFDHPQIISLKGWIYRDITEVCQRMNIRAQMHGNRLFKTEEAYRLRAYVMLLSSYNKIYI